MKINRSAPVSSDGRKRSEEVTERFGRNLHRCRRRASLSQEELARLASVHRTEIGMIERGIRLPRVDTLVKLAGSLSISPMELLEGIQWTTPDAPSAGHFAIEKRSFPMGR
jgi:transcriptional regulator with XRE-family HTH domain